MALACFRLSAHNLRVVRGRYAGEDYPARICALTGDENCFTFQDEMHMVFECQHSALSALRVHFEVLVDKAWGNTPAHGLHLFMNHRDVISVAKFVQQLQNLMDSLTGAPAENPELEDFSCLEFCSVFLAIALWASSLCKVTPQASLLAVWCKTWTR